MTAPGPYARDTCPAGALFLRPLCRYTHDPSLAYYAGPWPAACGRLPCCMIWHATRPVRTVVGMLQWSEQWLWGVSRSAASLPAYHRSPSPRRSSGTHARDALRPYQCGCSLNTAVSMLAHDVGQAFKLQTPT